MNDIDHSQRRKQRVATALGGMVAALTIGKGVSVLVTLDHQALLIASLLLLLVAGGLVAGLPLLDRAGVAGAPDVPSARVDTLAAPRVATSS